MKKIFVAIVLLVYSIVPSHSQEKSFTTEVSTDTLYWGNYLGLKYTIKNLSGDFQAPDLQNFQIVSGPNVSNQFSMINGDVTQSSSYEYVLKPINEGASTIGSASLLQNDQVLSTDPIEIIVVANPNDIIQDYRRFNSPKLNFTPTNTEVKNLTKADSIKMKLKKLKATKI